MPRVPGSANPPLYARGRVGGVNSDGTPATAVIPGSTASSRAKQAPSVASLAGAKPATASGAGGTTGRPTKTVAKVGNRDVSVKSRPLKATTVRKPAVPTSGTGSSGVRKAAEKPSPSLTAPSSQADPVQDTPTSNSDTTSSQELRTHEPITNVDATPSLLASTTSSSHRVQSSPEQPASESGLSSQEPDLILKQTTLSAPEAQSIETPPISAPAPASIENSKDPIDNGQSESEMGKGKVKETGPGTEAKLEPGLATPTPTSDSLQVAAQLYPWLYMTSTLDACFKSAEQGAMKDLKAKEESLEHEEEEIKDERTRFEAERAIDFFDELGKEEHAFAQKAPQIMQAFLAHGDACTRAEAEALELATRSPTIRFTEEEEEDWDAPLRVYIVMLDKLQQFYNEAAELEASILKLTISSPSAGRFVPDQSTETQMQPPLNSNQGGNTEGSAARSQILGVFEACLPVLRARMRNLEVAQELVDGAQENLSVSLRMESLGLND